MAYTTRQSLLDSLRKNDNSGWEEFRTIYAPLVHLLARKHCLTESESEELLQDVCVTIFQRKAISKYNPQVGLFRTYLGRIITNCANDILRKRPPSPVSLSTQRFNDIPAPSPSPAELAQAWEEFILEKALAEIRSRCDDLTYLAFDFHARKNRPAKEVAEALGISEQKVFQASSRITRRLRETIARMNLEFERP